MRSHDLFRKTTAADLVGDLIERLVEGEPCPAHTGDDFVTALNALGDLVPARGDYNQIGGRAVSALLRVMKASAAAQRECSMLRDSRPDSLN